MKERGGGCEAPHPRRGDIELGQLQVICSEIEICSTRSRRLDGAEGVREEEKVGERMDAPWCRTPNCNTGSKFSLSAAKAGLCRGRTPCMVWSGVLGMQSLGLFKYLTTTCSEHYNIK